MVRLQIKKLLVNKISLITLVLTVSLVLTFQNCGTSKSFNAQDNEQNNQDSVDCEGDGCENQSCLFNGTSIAHGDTISAYLTGGEDVDGECKQEARTCNNGVLSGSYAYATCTVRTPDSCLFNGKTIASGGSVTAFLNSSVPSGQQCVSQSRVCTDGHLSGSYSYANCVVNAPNSCLFDGKTIGSGASVRAYLESTVPFGQSCSSQDRVCTNGALSGSYTFSSCKVGDPASCLFDGKTVVSGSSVSAYKTGNVAYGQTCEAQSRLCTNGSLSGSYTFGSCVVSPAAPCLFNGKTIASGARVVGFKTDAVAFGSTCEQQDRVCTNGVLSGTYAFNSCIVTPAGSCSFNGRALDHGASVKAFQAATVPFGGQCADQTRICSNGKLSGSYAFPACVVSPAGACTFNGKAVAHGASVDAFLAASVDFGKTCTSQKRACTNGSLSGTYTFDACAVKPAATCTFNGKTIAHNATVSAFQTASVDFGKACVEQTRTCTNGVLSGTYTNAACTVKPAATCSFNGKAVAHGASVDAFLAASVDFGKTCTSQKRTCSNGALSGTYTNAACTVKPAAACSFNGKSVAHGASATAYLAASVPFGGSCTSQARVCTNGVLSGSYAYGSCTVAPVAACTFNGKTVAHGASVDAYKASSVPFGSACEDQKRTCSNGVLSGSYANSSCSVKPAAACTFNGKSVAHGAKVTAYSTASVAYGKTCSDQQRTCNNGTLSGSYAYAACKVDPLTCKSNQIKDVKAGKCWDLDDACTQAALVDTKKQTLNYPGNKSCPWGKDDNNNRNDANASARVEEIRTVSLPSNALMCSIDFKFNAQNFRYDDHFLFDYSGMLLAGDSKFFASRFSEINNSGVLQYQWSKIKGVGWNGKSGHNQPYCYGSGSTCSWPKTENNGTLALKLTQASIKKLSSLKSKSASHSFRMTIVGDDDGSDCQHKPVNLDVSIKYVVPEP